MHRIATVVLMCGLPGSGKSTHADGLVALGYTRLSLDTAIWQRLGGRDPGLVLSPLQFDALKEKVREEQRAELIELMRARKDVVVDYTFWSRAARADYRALIERYGCRWELHYLPANLECLRRRLAIRALAPDGDAVTVSEAQLQEYLRKFEEPSGEGEQIFRATDFP